MSLPVTVVAGAIILPIQLLTAGPVFGIVIVP